MTDTREPSPYGLEEERLAQALFIAHYEALKNIARSRRRRSHSDISMCTTEILHESYLKLEHVDKWQSEAHFVRTSVLAMRQVICDYARRRLSQKRNRDLETPIDETRALLPEFRETPEEIVAISDLISRLAEINPRWVQVLDARYFAGMTEEETAEILNVSVRTIRRDWQETRHWLAKQLQP